MRTPTYNMKYNTSGMTRSSVLFTSRYSHLWNRREDCCRLCIIVIHLFPQVETEKKVTIKCCLMYIGHVYVWKYIHPFTQITYIFITIYERIRRKLNIRISLSENVIKYVKLFTQICECLQFARFIIDSFLLEMLFLLQSIWKRIDI